MKNRVIQKDDVDITVLGIRHHHKASESYVDVIFNYSGIRLSWSIPIEYRRTGTHLADATQEELDDYLVQVYQQCRPSTWSGWRTAQSAFWATKNRADVTKEFFDALSKDFAWCSVSSELPPNPNWARRTQELKEFGYSIATDTNRLDKKTGRKCTHLLLLPLPRGGISGYETWSPQLRDRIIATLRCHDAFEGKVGRKEGLLPDHKFPEIRWDENTRRESLETLTEEDIRRDFQLLNNQRNQQKREVCRNCFQTGFRGTPFGIRFFYAGDERWPENVPKVGKQAEIGCVGCGWYDLEKWREELNKRTSSR